jgi:hypothetical protein
MSFPVETTKSKHEIMVKWLKEDGRPIENFFVVERRK